MQKIAWKFFTIHWYIHWLKKRVISVYYGLTLIVVILGGGDATEEVRESSLLTNPVYGVKWKMNKTWTPDSPHTDGKTFSPVSKDGVQYVTQTKKETAFLYIVYILWKTCQVQVFQDVWEPWSRADWMMMRWDGWRGNWWPIIMAWDGRMGERWSGK